MSVQQSSRQYNSYHVSTTVITSVQQLSRQYNSYHVSTTVITSVQQLSRQYNVIMSVQQLSCQYNSYVNKTVITSVQQLSCQCSPHFYATYSGRHMSLCSGSLYQKTWKHRQTGRQTDNATYWRLITNRGTTWFLQNMNISCTYLRTYSRARTHTVYLHKMDRIFCVVTNKCRTAEYGIMVTVR
jgi:hypothetical protein